MAPVEADLGPAVVQRPPPVFPCTYMHVHTYPLTLAHTHAHAHSAYHQPHHAERPGIATGSTSLQIRGTEGGPRPDSFGLPSPNPTCGNGLLRPRCTRRRGLGSACLRSSFSPTCLCGLHPPPFHSSVFLHLCCYFMGAGLVCPLWNRGPGSTLSSGSYNRKEVLGPPQAWDPWRRCWAHLTGLADRRSLCLAFQNMPNVRDHDASIYLRLQGDALSVGGYEANPIFWEEVRHGGNEGGFWGYVSAWRSPLPDRPPPEAPRVHT